MIQRIQTVFMFLSAVLGGLLFAFNLASFNYGEVLMNLSVLGVDNQIDATYFSDAYTWPLIVLAALLTAIPIYTLLIYKKRGHQVKLNQLDMFINAVFVVLVLLYYVPDVQESINADDVKYGVATFFPLVSMIFDLLAIKFVKKDIDLLRSVDRIR